MGVDQAIDITAEERQTVLSLLERHLPGTAAWVYGSRAKWTSRPQSDLDLVVFATPEQRREVGDLREAFAESNLPFRVDLFVWADVPESFRRQIELEHVALGTARHVHTSWPVVPLRDVVDLTLSSVDKKTKPAEQEVILCNYMDVYSNETIHEDLEFMAATASEREIRRCTLRPRDVVITKDSEQYDDIGVPALVRDDIANLVCGYHLAILRSFEELLHGPYLFCALKTKYVQQQFHAYANGVTRFGLRKEDILRVTIPLPPLHQQHAIAEILGAINDKIELNGRVNATLEAMARALFKSWFVDFDPVRAKMEGRDIGLRKEILDLFPDRLVESELGETPEGWPLTSLSELIDINPKRVLRKGMAGPYLDMANMPTRGHAPRSIGNRPYSSGMRFANGDTLVARITPCLENGKIALVDFLGDGDIGWGSTEYIVMKPKAPIPDEFAYCLARSTRFREFAVQNMSGTSGRQRVSATALSEFRMSVPPAGVATAFGQTTGTLFASASANASESRTLCALRDALLPKLVSGELHVRGADEFAAKIA